MQQRASEPNVATRAIFVVGVSRSGTTLMRRILNASDTIAIAPENHFLGHVIASEGMRQKFRKFGNLSDDNNVRRLVDYMYSPAFAKSSKLRGLSTLWRWIVEHVDKHELLQRILDSDRSERALFIIAMQVFADRKKKPMIGEKTPAHVRYVPTLIEWFPNARVIHMLRDPRAIFISELRRRQKHDRSTPYQWLQRFALLFKVFILFQTTLLWLESVYRYRWYKRRYPNNYYPLRFEDLVRDPEHHIRLVCDVIGVEFQDAMLQQMVVSKGFQVGHVGFDAGAAERWREQIDPWINVWFLVLFRKHLQALGYVA